MLVNNGNLFPPVPEARKTKTKEPANLESNEERLPDSGMVVFFLCPYMMEERGRFGESFF